jgi:serine/threonine protein phosphatase PrpC
VAWKAIARSAIGTSHLKQGLPCQDYGSDRLFSNLLIGAVADGAGSAKYADIGAKIAVETTIAHIAKTETYLEKIGCSWQNRRCPISESQAKRLFTSTWKRVMLQFQQAATAGNYDTQDLACTLIAFMATPNWVAAMQIGDGFLAMRFKCEKEYKLAFKPDKGEYANQTSFVTSGDALTHMQVQVFNRRPKFLCAATDAMETVAIVLKDWYPSPGFFKPLEEYMKESDRPEEQDEYLVNLLNSDQLNKRTNDDKTLLLCLYH